MRQGHRLNRIRRHSGGRCAPQAQQRVLGQVPGRLGLGVVILPVMLEMPLDALHQIELPVADMAGIPVGFDRVKNAHQNRLVALPRYGEPLPVNESRRPKHHGLFREVVMVLEPFLVGQIRAELIADHAHQISDNLISQLLFWPFHKHNVWAFHDPISSRSSSAFLIISNSVFARKNAHASFRSASRQKNTARAFADSARLVRCIPQSLTRTPTVASR